VARGLLGVGEVLPTIIRHGRLLLLVQLISRKLIRYLYPLLLVPLLVANLFLEGPFYRATLALQLIPYALVPVGYVCSKAGKKLRLLSLPYYFFIGNLAALLGLLKLLSLRELATWEGFDRRHDLKGEAID
jgi:hypothetical protein